MNKLLAKSDIFGTNDLPIERVDVPEWGGHVFVRTVRADERDAYLASLSKYDKQGNRVPVLANATARLCALTMCDEGNHPIFGEDDTHELGRKSPVALERVAIVARRLNALNDDALETAKGNSGRSQD